MKVRRILTATAALGLVLAMTTACGSSGKTDENGRVYEKLEKCDKIEVAKIRM